LLILKSKNNEKYSNELINLVNLINNNKLVPNSVKENINRLIILPENNYTFDDYTFYKSTDSFGNDIAYYPNKTISELKDICDILPNAIAFNTYGYIKSKITDESKFINLENTYNLYDGLYVKKLNNNIINYSYNYDTYNINIINKIIENLKNKKNLDKQITMTITTCKRLDLFKKTMDSFINCCMDIILIDEFICIDDNSSESDRNTMKELYPFFTFILKDESQRGHVYSMNMLVNVVKSDYMIHLEDDWLFTYKYDYITKSLEILNQKIIIPINTIPHNQNIHTKKIAQVLFNKNYIEIN
jgi:hypothetical protein